MKLINRDEYLNWLIAQKEKEAIKVVSGVRRSGKSKLLELYQNYLLENGIEKNQIIFINFENIDFEELQNYKKLHAYVKERLVPNKMNYVFLDEIQHVPSFEKTVDSLFILPNVDIYITGSNAYFLSTELATLLTGRFVELKILPFSFKEFCQNDFDNLEKKFDEYLALSSFPYNVAMNNNKREAKEYLNDLFNSILYKDIVIRKNITQITGLENLADFMFHSIGNQLNPTKIANTMTSKGNKIDVKTVQKYLAGLLESMLFYEAKRFNIKGKQFFKTNSKYYAVDMAMRNMRVGGRDSDIGHIIENIVYLELLRRYGKVFVGEVANGEVDFVVKTNDNYEYFQVTTTLTDSNTDRELASLEQIKDNYPKTILTLDTIMSEGNINGIKKRNLLKWLCA